MPPTSAPRDAPSEYARLEALAASAVPGEATVTPSDAPAPAGPDPSKPLVVIAEADPGLRAWVMRGLTEPLAADAPALRIQAVGTAERLVECLQREPVALVICGRLAPPADWPALLARLHAAATGGCVLVDHTGSGLAQVLNGKGQTVRLAEALVRLLERTPGHAAGDPPPPPPVTP